MRKALIVGIDYYEHISPLGGCVNDAKSVSDILERHYDNTVNFANPNVMLAYSNESSIKRSVLRQNIKELFAGDADIALFYFAGHGYIEDVGGFLCASDTETGDDGISLSEIISIANKSSAKNKVIILDSCHSGVTANRSDDTGIAEIQDGMTILTASTESQYAMETEDGAGGVFTTLFVDALEGAAANLLGDITPGSIYAHVDQSLGPWKQRPVFKTNVKNFISLRRSLPPIELHELQKIIKFFPETDYEFPLDPSFEPERSEQQNNDPKIPDPDPINTEIFATLQKYVKVNLLRSIDAPHMWHAAMQSKSCKLTVLGEHYRDLVSKGLI